MYGSTSELAMNNLRRYLLDGKSEVQLVPEDIVVIE